MRRLCVFSFLIGVVSSTPPMDKSTEPLPMVHKRETRSPMLMSGSIPSMLTSLYDFSCPVSHMRNDGPHHDRVLRNSSVSSRKDEGRPSCVGAADVWESARFTSIFLASSFCYISNIVRARPHAANANRWAAVQDRRLISCCYHFYLALFFQ